jgi:hypothetical protein
LIRIVVAFFGLVLPVAALAQQQKLPDPNRVAPQYRDVAEQHRAEALRRKFCLDKAEKEKVLKRDLAPYVNQCTDTIEKAQADAQRTKP